MFPFTINNTLKLFSHNNESVEDDASIKERINQTILQSLGSKKNVKINAIVVIECDNEPKRTLVINTETTATGPNVHIPNNAFASISTNAVTNNHTGGVLLQQPPLFSTTIEDLQALFNITASNVARQNVSLADSSNQMNFSFISTQNPSPDLNLKPEKITDSNNNNNSSSNSNNESSLLSSRKRKSEKPTKIPQDSPTDSNGLDLTLTVKSDHIIHNPTDTETKIERFFNCSLPIWPCPTSTDAKPFLHQQHVIPTIIAKPKKPPTIPGHKKSSKVFNCNQCKLQFNSLNALCKHTFSDHRAFRCTFCSANFTQRSNLQRHSLKHVGFKPFICNVCSKAYYRKDHLVRHIEVSHPGSDPKSNITVKLSSSECLEYLERMQNNRLMEMENTEDSKESMESLVLESIEKSPFALQNPDLDTSPSQEDGILSNNNINNSTNHIENNKFISFNPKDELESPGKLQISMEDNNIINKEINGIKTEESLITTKLNENSYSENLKNCI